MQYNSPNSINAGNPASEKFIIAKWIKSTFETWPGIRSKDTKTQSVYKNNSDINECFSD